jgi:hypothetical protein
MASGWPGKGHGALLKKWLSARSALQESPKTSLKHYENDVFGLRTGARESAKEFFNTLASLGKGAKRRMFQRKDDLG